MGGGLGGHLIGGLGSAAVLDEIAGNPRFLVAALFATAALLAVRVLVVTREWRRRVRTEGRLARFLGLPALWRVAIPAAWALVAVAFAVDVRSDVELSHPVFVDVGLAVQLVAFFAVPLLAAWGFRHVSPFSLIGGLGPLIWGCGASPGTTPPPAGPRRPASSSSS